MKLLNVKFIYQTDSSADVMVGDEVAYDFGYAYVNKLGSSATRVGKKLSLNLLPFGLGDGWWLYGHNSYYYKWLLLGSPEG